MLTLHVLDTAAGVPGAGIGVTLVRLDDEIAVEVARGTTDDGGRIAGGFGGLLAPAVYELRFEAGAYFAARGTPTLYGIIPVRFRIEGERQHYHIPLLLSPFGYTTYRGS